MFKKISVFSIAILLLNLVNAGSLVAFAAHSGTASFATHWFGPNQTVAIPLTVNNTGTTNYICISVKSPSSKYTWVSGSGSGWTGKISGNGDSLLFDGGPLTPGNSTSLTLNVTLPNENVANANLNVKSGNAASGSNSCPASQNINEAYSGALSIGVDATPPTAPSILSVTAIDQNTIQVISSASTDAGAGLHSSPYQFDETSGNSGATDSSWQSSVTYTDTGLQPNTQYCYRVKARDAVLNETAYSTAVCATTPPVAVVDTDGDGLDDTQEANLGTNPNNPDTDGDGLSDGAEVNTHNTNPLDTDTDNDGLNDGAEIAEPTDPNNPDSDGDGLTDGAEVNTYNTDPNNTDTDGDGHEDGTEVINGTDPLDPDDPPTYDPNADDDNDGLTNGQETTLGTDPNDSDSDNDGLSDGAEVNTHNTDPLDSDSDNDGLNDGVEINTYDTDPNNNDSDDDGYEDGEEILNGTDPNDPNDPGDPEPTDADGDGLTDDTEATLGTDPNNADTDGDGLGDGAEVNAYNTDPLNPDTDGDGLEDGGEISATSDPNNPDSDGDGLTDGDEVNTYNTDPNNTDTDGDGLTDFDEVNMHNSNPNDSDSDNDGLNDSQEVSNGTDPNSADSDNDNLTDAQELNTYNTDPVDPDSDNDGYNDGTEILNGTDPLDPNDPGDGGDDEFPDTDGDGLTDVTEATLGTDPNNPDTDGDILSDGQEVNIYDTNPLDDDSDGDGITDGEEVFITLTDPLSVDSDGDGINDGTEVNTYNTDPNSTDTDGDTYSDGNEITNGTDPLDPNDPGGGGGDEGGGDDGGGDGGGDTGGGGGGGGGGGNLDNLTDEELLNVNPQDYLLELQNPNVIQPGDAEVGAPGTNVAIDRPGESRSLVGILGTPGDFLPPIVNLSNISDGISSSESLSFTGTAVDSGGVIESVRISLDGGKSSFPASSITGIGRSRATFEFSINNLLDGDYEVIVFASDNSENEGKSTKYTITVDRYDPYIGTIFASAGVLGLLPDNNLLKNSGVGINEDVYVAVGGGANKVQLTDGKTFYDLNYLPENKLWKGTINFKEAGEKSLKIVAQDSAKNIREKNIEPIKVEEKGKVVDAENNEEISEYNLSVYQLVKETDQWKLWDGESFNQQNPIQINDVKSNSIILPKGTYYLEIKAAGYRDLITEKIILDKTEVVSPSAKLEQKPWYLKLADWGTLGEVNRAESVQGNDKDSKTEGFLNEGDTMPLTNFTVDKSTNEKSLLIFAPVWNPFGKEQIDVINSISDQELKKHIFLMTVLEPKGLVESFLARGLENVNIGYDKIGYSTDNINISSAPYIYLIDANGKILKREIGVISEEKIKNLFN